MYRSKAKEREREEKRVGGKGMKEDWEWELKDDRNDHEGQYKIVVPGKVQRWLLGGCSSPIPGPHTW